MILVIGQTGQLAQALAPMPEVTCLGREQVDLTNPTQAAKAIHRAAPSAVINAAAYTTVDRAEEEEALATVINGEAVGEMARACATLGIPFVTVSTDYVFDGSGTEPWHPDAPTAPLNAYGRSKLVGEEATRAEGGTVLRTSWVVSATGSNFVKTMLRLGETRDNLSVVADQIGAPTPAKALAACCHAMASQLRDTPKKAGTYHFAGTPFTSWADVAREVFAQAKLPCAVTDIPSEAYPTPATRPRNSRLDCRSTTEAFGIAPPDWRAGITDILADLGALP